MVVVFVDLVVFAVAAAGVVVVVAAVAEVVVDAPAPVVVAQKKGRSRDTHSLHCSSCLPVRIILL